MMPDLTSVPDALSGSSDIDPGSVAPVTASQATPVSRRRSLLNSFGNDMRITNQAQTRPTNTGVIRIPVKLKNGMPDDVPISMFWGFPMIVARDPMFAETARPIR